MDPRPVKTISPATLGRNSAPLEGYGAALLQIRLARGSVPPPLELGSASLEGRTPLRAGLRLAQGLSAPSSESPSRSGRGGRRPIPAPPAGAFNDLTPQVCTTTPTRLGITPRHCSTDSQGETIPATVRHCAERPVSALWHCAAYFCTANTSSSRRWTMEPLKGTNTFPMFTQDYTMTSGRREWSSPSLSVLCGHPRHCNATPGTAAPSATLLRRTGTEHRHARHCAS
jgi:hypothetical protein